MPQSMDSSSAGRVDAAVPLRRRRAQPPVPGPSPLRNRIINYALAFVALILVADALVGDKGLLESIRARRQYAEIEGALGTKRQENARLRDEIRRLKEDPASVEAIAREELGLIRPGEVLFIVHDAGPRR